MCENSELTLIEKRELCMMPERAGLVALPPRFLDWIDKKTGDCYCARSPVLLAMPGWRGRNQPGNLARRWADASRY